MKAIFLPYSCDQNEPSRPLRQVLELPTDIAKRDDLLKRLFIHYVCEVDEEDQADITIREGGENDYGDLVVELSDMYLFVTYLPD